MGSIVMQSTPTLIERRCGGWLAVSKPDATLKIGVTADTEEEARAAFDQAILEWQSILETEAVGLEH